MGLSIALELSKVLKSKCLVFASIGWVTLSLLVLLSRIPDIFTYLQYMMFKTTQTIYFLRGCAPSNVSSSAYTHLMVVWWSPIMLCLTWSNEFCSVVHCLVWYMQWKSNYWFCAAHGLTLIYFPYSIQCEKLVAFNKLEIVEHELLKKTFTL